MSFVPRPHQVSNARILYESLKNFGAGLDASDTGVGKTFTALMVCKAVGARPAIITPKAVISGWEEACQMVGIEPLFISGYEAARSKNFKFAKLETIESRSERDGVEKVSKKYKFHWDQNLGRVIFIFDEVQRCRSTRSIQGKMLLAAAERYKTLMLSATPFTTPLEAEAITRVLKLTNVNGYYRWCLQHGCKKGYFAPLEFIGDKPDGKKNPPGTNAMIGQQFMAKIHGEIFPTRGCRTRRGEIPDFPETVYETLCIDVDPESEMTHKYRKALDEARQMDMEKIAAQLPPELKQFASPLQITHDLRNRQEAEILKGPSIVEMVEDARTKGEAVIVVVNFDLTMELLADVLQCDLLIRGEKARAGRDMLDRSRMIKLFQNNHRDLILVNACAGGAGLSLHDYVSQKPRRVIISPPWSAIVLKQVFGRAHRLGGGFSRQQLVFSKNTIEERVMQRVKNRLSNLDYLVDGDLSLDLSVTQ